MLTRDLFAVVNLKLGVTAYNVMLAITRLHGFVVSHS